MRIRWICHAPDTDTNPAGGASPTEPLSVVTPAALAAPTTPAPAEPEPDEEDDEPADEGTPTEWQAETARLRRQSARYRTERNTLRAQVTELEARLAAQPAPTATPDPALAAETRAQAAERRALIAEAAAESGIPAQALATIRQLQTATDETAIREALTALAGHLRPTSAGVPNPPGTPSAPLTLDEQIRQAQQQNDTPTLLRLKAQKLVAIRPAH